MAPGFTPIDELQNNWIRERTTNLVSSTPNVPLTDDERAAVDRIVLDAPVVGIGEATHGSKAIIQSTERILRFLIEERKAEIVVLEACFAATQTLDRYVVHGVGEAEEAIVATGVWSYANEETLGFVKWLRNFNRTRAGTNRPVRIFGCDCQSIDGPKRELIRQLQGFKRSGVLSQEDLAKITDLLKTLPTDRDLFRFVEMLIHEGASKNPDVTRIAEIETRQAAFTATVRESIEKVSHRLLEVQQALPSSVPSDDGFEFDRCRRLLEQAIEFYSPGDSLNKRDLLMAENVLALRKHFQSARVLLLTHNLHVARIPLTVHGYEYLFMGCQLARQLGSDYRVIGSTFYDGKYLALADCRPEEDLIAVAHTPGPLAFESLLQRVTNDRSTIGLLLDLGGDVGKGREFPWQNEFEMRIGASGDQGNYESCFVPQRPELQYDGMMFLKETSPISVLPAYYQHATQTWKPNDRDST